MNLEKCFGRLRPIAFDLFGVVLLGCFVWSGCTTSAKPKVESPVPTPLEAAAEKLTIAELEAASLALRVIYDQSMETWRGPGDEAIPGCSISGEYAEKALALVTPILEQKAQAEAARLAANPRSYRLPLSAETCDRDCTCSMGVRILQAAKIDGQAGARSGAQTGTKFREWKKLRALLEAKSELQSKERSAQCVESMTWVCAFLKP